MGKVCEKCGREYRFPICEFCARENIWNARPIETHIGRYFTPRMMLEFEEYSTSKMNKYVGTIADTLEKTKGAGVYIWENKPRTGKTILAMFLFVELLKRAYINGTSRDFIFTAMMDLLDKEREYADIYPSERRGKISPILTASLAPLLVLDDFGTEKGIFTPASYEAIYKLINYRYEYLLPTIFTSNRSIEGLLFFVDDARIPSRIGRMCSQVIKFHFNNLTSDVLF